ncbi:FimV/HubP family polar landmark protein [Salinimonas sediminis]|uniref:AAA family ATPase n=1 Tax=Salinimonas sediminis TaxID=2303538 RepID=A0A346NNF5_9ALTE|nr:FimV/HubP family polar landmark protein [Salinimonas sediminis]AXR07062.1 hypothetical protein D0Y50_12300 [Salinimonas sediminis]
MKSHLTGLLVLLLLSAYPVTDAGAQERQTQLRGPKNATSQYSGAVYGPIDEQDTLWRIADRYRQDKSVSVYQVMLAIYELNPNAFEQDNLNLLVQGATLRLPSQRYTARVNKAQAQARADRDDARYAELLKQPSTTNNNIKPAEPLVNRADLSDTRSAIEQKITRLDEQQVRQFDELRQQFSSSLDNVQALLDENRKLYKRVEQVNTDLMNLRQQVEGDVQSQMDEQLALQRQLLDMVKQEQAERTAEKNNSLSSTLTQPASLIIGSGILTLLLAGGLAAWLLRKRNAEPEALAPQSEPAPAVASDIDIDDRATSMSPDLEDDTPELTDDELFNDDELLDDVLSSELEDTLDSELDSFSDLDDDMLVPDDSEQIFEDGESELGQDDLDSLFDDELDDTSLDDEALDDSALEGIDLADDDTGSTAEEDEVVPDDDKTIDELLAENQPPVSEDDFTVVTDDASTAPEESAPVSDAQENALPTMAGIADDGEEQPEISIDDLLEAEQEKAKNSFAKDNDVVDETMLGKLDSEINQQNAELDRLADGILEEIDQLEQMGGLPTAEELEEEEQAFFGQGSPQGIQSLDGLVDDIEDMELEESELNEIDTSENFADPLSDELIAQLQAENDFANDTTDIALPEGDEAVTGFDDPLSDELLAELSAEQDDEEAQLNSLSDELLAELEHDGELGETSDVAAVEPEDSIEDELTDDLLAELEAGITGNELPTDAEQPINEFPVEPFSPSDTGNEGENEPQDIDIDELLDDVEMPAPESVDNVVTDTTEPPGEPALDASVAEQDIDSQPDNADEAKPEAELAEQDIDSLLDDVEEAESEPETDLADAEETLAEDAAAPSDADNTENVLSDEQAVDEPTTEESGPDAPIAEEQDKTGPADSDPAEPKPAEAEPAAVDTLAEQDIDSLLDDVEEAEPEADLADAEETLADESTTPSDADNTENVLSDEQALDEPTTEESGPDAPTAEEQDETEPAESKPAEAEPAADEMLAEQDIDSLLDDVEEAEPETDLADATDALAEDAATPSDADNTDNTLSDELAVDDITAEESGSDAPTAEEQDETEPAADAALAEQDIDSLLDDVEEAEPETDLADATDTLAEDAAAPSDADNTENVLSDELAVDDITTEESGSDAPIAEEQDETEPAEPEPAEADPAADAALAEQDIDSLLDDVEEAEPEANLADAEEALAEDAATPSDADNTENVLSDEQAVDDIAAEESGSDAPIAEEQDETEPAEPEPAEAEPAAVDTLAEQDIDSLLDDVEEAEPETDLADATDTLAEDAAAPSDADNTENVLSDELTVDEPTAEESGSDAPTAEEQDETEPAEPEPAADAALAEQGIDSLLDDVEEAEPAADIADEPTAQSDSESAVHDEALFEELNHLPETLSEADFEGEPSLELEDDAEEESLLSSGAPTAVPATDDTAVQIDPLDAALAEFDQQLMDDIPSITDTVNDTNTPKDTFDDSILTSFDDNEDFSLEQEQDGIVPGTRAHEGDINELEDVPGLDEWLSGNSTADKDILDELEGSDFDDLLGSMDDDSGFPEPPVNNESAAENNAAASPTAAEDAFRLANPDLDLAALLNEPEDSVGGNEPSAEPDYLDVETLLDESMQDDDRQFEEMPLDLDVSLSDFSGISDDADIIDIDKDAGQNANLDLARVYMEMDDMPSARELLEEVIEKGSEEQKKEAVELLGSLV